MKILAFFNNKGGVGKTTAALNVACTLAKQGNSVLFMDCDGQQNASRFLCDELPDADHGLEKLLLTAPPITPCILTLQSRYENLDVIAATPVINDATEKYSAQSDSLKQSQLEAIRDWEKPWNTQKYDFIIMDLPPALNCVTEALLTVTDGVLVPIELGSFAVQGLANVTDTVNRCDANFLGCFISKYDGKNATKVQMLEMLRTKLGAKMFQTIIPQSKIIDNSISYRQTAAEYMGWLPAAKSFEKLTAEIQSKL